MHLVQGFEFAILTYLHCQIMYVYPEKIKEKTFIC